MIILAVSHRILFGLSRTGVCTGYLQERNERRIGMIRKACKSQSLLPNHLFEYAPHRPSHGVDHADPKSIIMATCATSPKLALAKATPIRLQDMHIPLTASKQHCTGVPWEAGPRQPIQAEWERQNRAALPTPKFKVPEQPEHFGGR